MIERFLDWGRGRRYLRLVPPFCWGRQYYKFGLILTALGYVSSYGMVWLNFVFGIEYFPVIWLGFLTWSFIYKANIMRKVRPCVDCPFNGEKNEKL